MLLLTVNRRFQCDRYLILSHCTLVGMTNGAFPKGPSGGAIPNPNSSSHLKDVDNVRNYFPETWLWTNATTG